MRRFVMRSAILFLIGCAGTPDLPESPEPIRVAAASDLQTVFPRLVEAFRERGGGEVIATFGASGQFAQQLQQGAPFDLFLSANRKYVSDLVDARVIVPQSVQDYARGTLVLVVRDEVPEAVQTLADLSDPAVKKIAIANPEVAPYGLAARQALEKSGLWDALEPKRVQAESVRQALQFVQSGNAEAGLVGKAIADVPGVRVLPINDSLYSPLWQAMGVVQASDNKAAAAEFGRFVASKEGRAVLRGAGFHVEDSP